MTLRSMLQKKSADYDNGRAQIYQGSPDEFILTPIEREAMRLDITQMLNQNLAARNRSAVAAATRYASRQGRKFTFNFDISIMLYFDIGRVFATRYAFWCFFQRETALLVVDSKGTVRGYVIISLLENHPLTAVLSDF